MGGAFLRDRGPVEPVVLLLLRLLPLALPFLAASPLAVGDALHPLPAAADEGRLTFGLFSACRLLLTRFS